MYYYNNYNVELYIENYSNPFDSEKRSQKHQNKVLNGKEGRNN